jgi:hypothetical protein
MAAFVKLTEKSCCPALKRQSLSSYALPVDRISPSEKKNLHTSAALSACWLRAPKAKLIFTSLYINQQNENIARENEKNFS